MSLAGAYGYCDYDEHARLFPEQKLLINVTIAYDERPDWLSCPNCVAEKP